MGYYVDRVLLRVVNFACGMKSNEPMRQRRCEGLHGRVVELGFGSGHNVPFYPSGVVEVTAIEPDDLAWELATDRLTSATLPVRRGGLDGQRLTLDDDSCDSALSTWTMCTIPDVSAALG